VWKGLEIKTCDPKSFVTEVISDTGNKACFGSCCFLIYSSLTVWTRVVRKVKCRKDPELVEEVAEFYRRHHDE
jgi:hypothetical protein